MLGGYDEVCRNSGIGYYQIVNEEQNFKIMHKTAVSLALLF